MPIQVIWGDDTNSCDKEIQNIINQNVSKIWVNLNLSKFNGEENNQVHQALDEMQTPPLGEGSRVILVKNNPIFNSKDNTLINKFELNSINIPSSTYLILLNTQKPDARLKTTKILQKLIKNGTAKEISFELPSTWDKENQKRYIENIAKDMNIKLDINTPEAIIESIGLDSKGLYNELKKASIYLKAKNELILTVEHVKEIFNDHQSNIFRIIEFLLKNEINDSLKEIQNLIIKGEPPLRLNAGLISQMRVHTVISLMGNDKDLTKISNLAGISNPKRIFYIRRNVQNCSPNYLINLMSKLLKIESSLKKGNNPINVFTENLITLTK
tara:strand:- start:762 stop:1745 length:984 start_codon:yes stop_codon:yes gene_type:complete